MKKEVADLDKMRRRQHGSQGSISAGDYLLAAAGESHIYPIPVEHLGNEFKAAFYGALEECTPAEVIAGEPMYSQDDLRRAFVKASRAVDTQEIDERSRLYSAGFEAGLRVGVLIEIPDTFSSSEKVATEAITRSLERYGVTLMVDHFLLSAIIRRECMRRESLRLEADI